MGLIVNNEIYKYLFYFLVVYMRTEYLNNKVFEKVISKFQSSEKAITRYDLIIEDWQGTIERKRERGTITVEEEERAKHSIQKHKEALKENDTSRYELAIAFHNLSEHLVRFAKFQLIDDDDAIQEGVLICFQKVDRFDPRKGKAFNYMTTCILNHFRQMYRTARNYNELKKKYLSYLRNLGDQVSVHNGKERPKTYKSNLYSN